MEITLNVFDRIVLLGVLPQKGSYSKIKVVRSIREQVALSENEVKKYNFRKENDGYVWSDVDKDGNKLDLNKTINFTPKQLIIISEELEKLADSEDFTESHISIYEKFVGDGNKESK